MEVFCQEMLVGGVGLFCEEVNQADQDVALPAQQLELMLVASVEGVLRFINPRNPRFTDPWGSLLQLRKHQDYRDSRS